MFLQGYDWNSRTNLFSPPLEFFLPRGLIIFYILISVYCIPWLLLLFDQPFEVACRSTLLDLYRMLGGHSTSFSFPGCMPTTASSMLKIYFFCYCQKLHIYLLKLQLLQCCYIADHWGLSNFLGTNGILLDLVWRKDWTSLNPTGHFLQALVIFFFTIVVWIALVVSTCSLINGYAASGI